VEDSDDHILSLNTDNDDEGDDSAAFDVPQGDGSNHDDHPEMACHGIDFLFVIDNSGSMSEEQEALVSSFPGFINAIGSALREHDAEDYHVMVVDTDGAPKPDPAPWCASECFQGAEVCSDGTHCALVMDSDCFATCSLDPQGSCDGGEVQCEDILCEDPCTCTLGAGRMESGDGEACGLDGPQRYLTGEDSDLAASFSCLAHVGTDGDGNELPAQTLSNALATSTNAEGGCNEAFVRDDTILVVTVITDEEDNKSGGHPDLWKQAVLDARGGDESGVVMLGLVGDTGTPGALCDEELAEASPLLREFVTSFEHHILGSVCAAGYDGFFEDAVELIEYTCDTFEPPG
jgi:hypothetical protein